MNSLLALLLVLSVTEAFAQSDSMRLEIVNPPSGVRQQANYYTQELDYNLRLSHSQNEKFRAINRATIQLMVLKDNALTQTLEDEGYIELVIEVLDAVPRGKAFAKADCDKYENDLINEFEPYAEEAPLEPAVKPGWNALQALCR